jgi:opacity protein-like surface antigen
MAPSGAEREIVMTTQRRLLAAAALAALLAAGPAAAQTSGWYIGGGAGFSKASFERGDFTGLATGATYTSDDTDTAPRMFGGYRIAPNWGVEFGIAVLGRFKHRYVGATGTAVYNYDASAATVALAAYLPIGGGVSLNGRVGAAFTAARLSHPSTSGTNIATPRACDTTYFDECTSTKTNLYVGVGGQFDINPRWGIRLDYDNYGRVGEQLETGRAKIEQWSANVLFRF